MGRRIDLLSRAFDWINDLLLGVMVVVTAYPILYVLLASISDPAELMAHHGILLKPYGFTFGAYALVFRNPMIPTGFMNTVLYVVTSTAISLVMTMMLAYVLSRKNFYWKNALMFFATFTMFFSGGMIPSFLMIQKLGIFNTRWAVILPGAISTYNLIVMRTSLMSLPDSLEESAKIDGASHWVILLRIVIPLSLPVLSVMLLFYGVDNWNSWFMPSIYLRKRELFPLSLIVREILMDSQTSNMMVEMDSAERGQNYSQIIKYTVIVISTFPILCVYPFLQKYFVKGVMIGAIKG